MREVIKKKNLKQYKMEKGENKKLFYKERIENEKFENTKSEKI